MIFATVGTQKQDFQRFYELIKNIKGEQIIFQYGNIKINKPDVDWFSFENDLDKYISKCEILITHGGVATIMKGLELNKKVIVLPRKKEFEEHVDDHQFEITDKLSKLNYIYKIENISEINEVIKKIKTNEIKLKCYTFTQEADISELMKELR